MGLLAQVADVVDPDKQLDRPELSDPVALASSLDPKYQVRPHLRVMGREYAALERGDFDRLLLNTPPQVGKSTTAVEWAAFWWLCRRPDARIIVASYGDDLALRRGKAIRRLVEKYGARYGLVLERGSANMKDWQVSTGGGVRSAGVGSAITGMDADLILIDDPTKNRAEADSLPMRERVYGWYSADLLSRQQPDTRIVLIQTPWHPDDLRARVIADEGDAAQGGRWRVVLMAAICEQPDKDPLGRGVGEPLSHPKIAPGDTAKLLRHWENLRGAVAVRDWRALWQCDPKAPEGVLLSWEMLRERRCWQSGSQACSTPVRVGVAVDPSGGGRDTAGVVGGFLGEDGRCHIAADASGVMSSADWARAACEMAADLDADFFVYETNYGGDMVLLAIRTAWEALRREQPERFGVMVPRLVAVSAKRGKTLRAEPVAQQWKEGRVVTSAYLPDLESEWATWTPGPSSPGRIDASVYLALELLPVPTSGTPSTEGAVMLSQVDMLGGLWRN
ncbi:MAG TPA: terminase family protein [Actinoplanes sp.]|nr:terminase family protein [Actinoplanes sp.]